MKRKFANTLDDYQRKATRTINTEPGTPDDECIMGVMGETGEFIEVIKKHLHHGHGIAGLGVEAGDLTCYLAALCTKHNLMLGDCWMLVADATFATEATIFDLSCGLYSAGDDMKDSINSPPFLSQGIGRAMWICFELCGRFGFDCEIVLARNIEKTTGRYPDGFSSEASINRVVEPTGQDVGIDVICDVLFPVETYKVIGSDDKYLKKEDVSDFLNAMIDDMNENDPLTDDEAKWVQVYYDVRKKLIGE